MAKTKSRGMTVEGLIAAREASIRCFTESEASIDRMNQGLLDFDSNRIGAEEFVSLAKREHAQLNQVRREWEQAFNHETELYLLSANQDTASCETPFDATLPPTDDPAAFREQGDSYWNHLLRGATYSLGHQAAGLHLRAAICSANICILNPQQPGRFEEFWKGIERRRKLNPQQIIPRIKLEWSRAAKLLSDAQRDKLNLS